VMFVPEAINSFPIRYCSEAIMGRCLYGGNTAACYP
jgi:hypothetical protein